MSKESERREEPERKERKFYFIKSRKEYMDRSVEREERESEGTPSEENDE